MKSKRAFTLVELLVVVSIIGLLVSILLPSLSKAREQARAVKCLANLHAQAMAIQGYTSEYSGTLPGPIHPAIKRRLFDLDSSNPQADRQKSLTWLLRPYFSKGYGDADREDARSDAINTCPTAEKIVTDQEFYAVATSGCWKERPYSYVANSWGVISNSSSISKIEANQTNPPHYFGAWFYCDSASVRDGRTDVAWRPKQIGRIKRPGEEWATADAWYRKVANSPRSGNIKEWLGTFAPEIQNYLAVIPDRPYHKIRRAKVSSHRRVGLPVLEQIKFKGQTNMSYFDGHAAPFSGQWRNPGDGGTVNPMWTLYGGPYDNSNYDWSASNFN
ncbi:MAG: hypothetical protein DHS20C16_15450 [Phycisphaerae bacterium]|nr:MAG: hypothetical protein DHS20C16_15450 [Phycisphaerae bacterium]